MSHYRLLCIPPAVQSSVCGTFCPTVRSRQFRLPQNMNAMLCNDTIVYGEFTPLTNRWHLAWILQMLCPLAVKQDIVNWLNTNPLETLTVPHLVKKFPKFCRNGCLTPTIARVLRPVPILSQIDPLHTRRSYLMKTHFNIIFLSTPRSSKPYISSVFPRNPYIHVSSIRATWYTHLILLHIITPITVCKEYESWSISSPLPSYILPLRPK